MRQIADPDAELLDQDEAMRDLVAENPTQAQLVELQLFAGLTGDRALEVLKIFPSTATVIASTHTPGCR